MAIPRVNQKSQADVDPAVGATCTMRAQLLLAASTLALQRVPLQRQATTRRRLSVGGRTDLNMYIGNELQTCGAVAGNPDLCKVGDTAENCRKSCGTCGVFVETPRPSTKPSPAPTEDFEASGRDRSVSARGLPAMGWLLVFVVVGLVAAAVMCLVCRKKRSARLNSEDNWQAQWSQVSSQTPAGGAVELHQVGVRNPMADDREKGFSDVNL